SPFGRASIAWVAFAVLAGFACEDPPTVAPCKNIPSGGCPKSHGAAVCDDPACTAIYACNPDQTWTRIAVCESREAGAADASVRVRDAAPRDALVDAPPGSYGGPGCSDLQAPDCALGVALGCPADSCCGCEDLFVCDSSSWRLWGRCEGGALIE